MFNFFGSIAGIIDTVVNYVVGFFTSLATIITRTVQALAYLVEVLAFTPPYVQVFILAMISVSVILFVINKGD